MIAKFLIHKTGSRDRWDLIAYRYYGFENKTAPIIEANKHLFQPNLEPLPEILPQGLELKIPILQREILNQDLLPPWKRGVVYGG